MSELRRRAAVLGYVPLAVLLLALPAHAVPHVENLGTLPGPRSSLTTEAQGISDDGNVAAGYSLVFDQRTSRAKQFAFRWSQQEGMRPLPYLAGGGGTASAQSVSADGRVIVGMSDGHAAQASRFWSHATRWRQGEQPYDLGTLPGADESAAFGVSSDGEYIVGYSKNRYDALRAVRWQNNSPPLDLGTLGGERSLANAISRNGNAIVGVAENAAQRPRAFLWSASTGMKDLGTLPGAAASLATAVSANGNAIVGFSADQIDSWLNPQETVLRGFLWQRSAGRMQEIANTLGGTSTLPLGVADDGRSVVGIALDAHGEPHAFRWTPENGMTAETALPSMLQMHFAKGLSADGRFSVGGLADGAFRADWR